MQEDQIYSMQDYIHQYQQLVCQYRNENASLKRQLSQGYSGSEPDAAEPQPIPSRRASPAPPAIKPAPQFEPPVTPGVKQAQPPEQQIEIDVPPLKQSSANNDDSGTGAQETEVATQVESESHVLQASYEEPVPNTEPQQTPPDGAFASATVVSPQTSHDAPTQDILVSGEVVENDAGGGPRMAIDVTPFDESGRVQPFEGNVSLMILAPDANGKKQSVGRWDFKPKEVQASVDPNANEPTMRFHVEVPAGTPFGKATELWVRLVPIEGPKQLAHANVDLTRPGVFSSQTNKIWKSEETVLAASYEEPVESAEPAIESMAPSGTLVEGIWATATPNRPANLTQDLASPTQGWRTSSQPIPPPVLANTTASTPTHRFDKLREEVKASQSAEQAAEQTAAKEVPPRRPGPWAPERSGKIPRSVAARPSWSATR